MSCDLYNGDKVRPSSHCIRLSSLRVGQKASQHIVATALVAHSPTLRLPLQAAHVSVHTLEWHARVGEWHARVGECKSSLGSGLVATAGYLSLYANLNNRQTVKANVHECGCAALPNAPNLKSSWMTCSVALVDRMVCTWLWRCYCC